MCFTRNNSIEYSLVPVISTGENKEPSEDSKEDTSNSNNKNQDKKLKVTFAGEEHTPAENSEDEDEEKASANDEEPFLCAVTRSGRTIQPRKF